MHKTQPPFFGGPVNGVFKLKEITKRFGPFVANDHISMEVEKGRYGLSLARMVQENPP